MSRPAAINHHRREEGEMQLGEQKNSVFPQLQSCMFYEDAMFICLLVYCTNCSCPPPPTCVTSVIRRCTSSKMLSIATNSNPPTPCTLRSNLNNSAAYSTFFAHGTWHSSWKLSPLWHRRGGGKKKKAKERSDKGGTVKSEILNGSGAPEC